MPDEGKRTEEQISFIYRRSAAQVRKKPKGFFFVFDLSKVT